MARKILIVDDNLGDIKLMNKLLSQDNLDFELFSVQTGEQAIQMAAELNPDLILLDTLLPGIDGIETCRQIKKMDQLKTKIIIITGSLDAVNEQRAMEAGADGYGLKLADSLLTSILSVLSG